MVACHWEWWGLLQYQLLAGSEGAYQLLQGYVAREVSNESCQPVRAGYHHKALKFSFVQILLRRTESPGSC